MFLESSWKVLFKNLQIVLEGLCLKFIDENLIIGDDDKSKRNQKFFKFDLFILLKSKLSILRIIK